MKNAPLIMGARFFLCLMSDGKSEIGCERELERPREALKQIAVER